MKTLKWLKRSKISFLLFLGGCLLMCFYLYYYKITLDNRWWGFGMIGMCGWILNPFPLIFAVVGFLRYLSERREAEVRTAVGIQWLYFPGIILGYAVVWYWSCCHFVWLTGGV